MNTREEPRKSTYVIATESHAEMTRLLHQDQATTSVTGLLPAGLTLRRGARILDVACGPGGWACTLASTYPEVQVRGIDISQTMLAYANATKEAQHLPNLSFQLIDVTVPWKLADASFDLVNARHMVGFLTGETWQHVLAEMQRVLVPEGSIVLAELVDIHTNAPAHETLQFYAYRSMRLAGLGHHSLSHHFGITPLLGQYLHQGGLEEIGQEAHVIDFSAGAPARRAMVENIKAAHKLIQPYIVRQGVASQQELDALYEQFLGEVEAPDFRGLFYLLRIWGKKPVPPPS